jgi:hypothetical protein
LVTLGFCRLFSPTSLSLSLAAGGFWVGDSLASFRARVDSGNNERGTMNDEVKAEDRGREAKGWNQRAES